MATFISEARTEIIDAVRTGLNDATIKGFDIEDAERINWRDLVDRYERNATGEKLGYPWVVVGYEGMGDSDWGLANDAYEFHLTIWYVDGIRNGTSTGKTTDALRDGIETKLNAVKDAFRADSTGKFQMLDTGLSFDLSVNNAANSYFMSANVPLFAGALSMIVLVGQPM